MAGSATMNNLGDDERDAVKMSESVGKALTVATGIAGAFVVARGAGVDAVKIPGIGVDVSVNLAWAPLTALTIWHLFVGWSFLETLWALWENSDVRVGAADPALQHVFRTMTIDGKWFFRRMAPRAVPRRPGSRRYKMRLRDPSTVVSCVALLIGVVAVVPWHWDGGFQFAGTTTLIVLSIVALVLAFANWTMGATWAVAISQLTVPRDQARWYLEHRPFLQSY
jgi:hypothetical protein